MKINNKIYEVLSMDMDSAINWLIENQSNIAIVDMQDLTNLIAYEAKRGLFSAGKNINEDRRIVSKSQSIAVAHILNEVSEINENFDAVECFEQ